MRTAIQAGVLIMAGVASVLFVFDQYIIAGFIVGIIAALAAMGID